MEHVTQAFRRELPAVIAALGGSSGYRNKPTGQALKNLRKKRKAARKAKR